MMAGLNSNTNFMIYTTTGVAGGTVGKGWSFLSFNMGPGTFYESYID